MTRRKNSARDQPLTQVDITPETLYNLNKLVEQNASLLALLENYKTGPQDALKSELKGVSDMNKRFRQRVRIGVDQAGKPVYKWATGYSVDELNDSIVRIYFENNMAGKFMDEAVAPKPTNCPTFQEYAEKWYQTYKAAALKHTTARSYTSALNLHLYPFFGKMKLNEITVELIQQFLNEKEYLAYSTVHSMLIVFNNIMASAFEDELIQRISGHANITTTLNIYTHTREEEIQAAGAKVGKLIGS